MFLPFVALLASGPGSKPEIVIDLRTRRPISRLIYGINNAAKPDLPYGLYRYGGNANTPYNWETNLNNAGTDYLQQSGYGWPLRFTPKENWGNPAAGVIHHQETALRIGAEAIIQVNVIGYVAADGNGPVGENEIAPSKRWIKVVAKKGKPFATTPDLTDGVVYTDEMVDYLVRKFGPAKSPSGIKWYELDNEPGLWSFNHPRIHPAKLTCRELVAKSIEVATAIKAVDPSAKIIGPSSTNFYDAEGLAGAPDWEEIKKKGGYDWFLDYYLDEFNKASKRLGIRLLDCLDCHYYIEGATPNDGGTQGVLQGARQMWDPTYVEPTWIGEVLGRHLPVIPNMKKSVARYYPGTLVGITEWNSQMVGTLVGSIATADMIGAIGAHGLDLACWWSLMEKEVQDVPRAYSVWKLYLNYDGKGGRFGDVGHAVKNADNYNYSIYASTDSKTEDLHVILISKRRHLNWNAQFDLPKNRYQFVGAYGFGSQAGDTLAPYKDVEFDGKTVKAVLPKLTAVHLVFRNSNPSR